LPHLGQQEDAAAATLCTGQLEAIDPARAASAVSQVSATASPPAAGVRIRGELREAARSFASSIASRASGAWHGPRPSSVTRGRPPTTSSGPRSTGSPAVSTPTDAGSGSPSAGPVLPTRRSSSTRQARWYARRLSRAAAPRRPWLHAASSSRGEACPKGSWTPPPAR
jgi:hypothetical protein